MLQTLMLISLVVVVGSLGWALKLKEDILRKARQQEILLQIACFVMSLWLILFGLDGYYPLVLLPCAVFLIVMVVYRLRGKRDDGIRDQYGRRHLGMKEVEHRIKKI